MQVISIVGLEDSGKTTFCNNLENWLILRNNGICVSRMSVRYMSARKKKIYKSGFLNDTSGMGNDDFRGIYRVNIKGNVITIGISSPGDTHKITENGFDDITNNFHDIDYLFVTARKGGEHQFWHNKIENTNYENYYFKFYTNKLKINDPKLAKLKRDKLNDHLANLNNQNFFDYVVRTIF